MNRCAGLGAALVLAVAVGGCGSDASPPQVERTTTSSATDTPSGTAAPVVMPDLRGLPSEVAGLRLVRFAQRHDLDLGQNWARPVLVHDCETRPDTIARQRPAPGAPLTRRINAMIRTAELDLDVFRGPCDPMGGELGPVTGQEAEIARAFYRFSADPSLDAPFASDDLWVGIEGGPTAIHLDAAARSTLGSWEIDALYAERSGPFSALDVVASSGGYYAVHRGIPGCAGTTDDVPAELTGLRPITLTPPADVVRACLEWWGVTLFLDDAGLIHGVALRLGSP